MTSKNIRESMTSGEWFHPDDIAFIEDSARVSRVMRRFNNDESLTDDERIHLLRSLFAHIGNDSYLCTGVRVDYGYNISIGDNCFFNYDCLFLDGAPITFGDRVMVGPRCQFVTPLHPLLANERYEQCVDGNLREWECERPITVEDDVWIASGVIVNPGVTIGARSVIGSGSVVTRDIPSDVFAAGNPCRVIREITEADAVGLRKAEQTDDSGFHHQL